jgi:hypothetical protein
MSKYLSGIGELLEEVESKKRSLQRPNITVEDEIWYRGHSDPNYVLLPTLLREAEKLRIFGDDVRQFESDLFFEFQAKGLSLMGNGLSDWDQLFVMRHHGLPTRLLDWSESFAVSVYFAMERVWDDPKAPEPVLKLLNPYALNGMLSWKRKANPDAIDLFSPRFLSWEQYPKAKEGKGARGEYWDYGELLVEQDGVDWKSPVALYPIRNSSRVRAQHGWFTIHGTDTHSIEKLAPKTVEEVIIKRKYWNDIRLYLESTGIDKFQIYADLDSLAASICTKARLLWKNRAKRS